MFYVFHCFTKHDIIHEFKETFQKQGKTGTILKQWDYFKSIIISHDSEFAINKTRINTANLRASIWVQVRLHMKQSEPEEGSCSFIIH
jgi:hypothetical protein